MNPSQRFRDLAEHPPAWMRLLFVPMFAPVALGMTSKRGWTVGVVAVVVYGGIGLGMAVVPSGVVAWSRRHPVFDGAILGPLTFLGVAYLTRWPLYVCALAGLAGVIIGALGGIRRARHLVADESALPDGRPH